jgi:hypothetical protein
MGIKSKKDRETIKMKLKQLKANDKNRTTTKLIMDQATTSQRRKIKI